jgi:hypothetical protein
VIAVPSAVHRRSRIRPDGGEATWVIPRDPADEGRGLLFATDRDAKQLNAVDPKTHFLIGTAPLASGPDYVRYVSPTGEVWVTEPGAARIEVFSLPQRAQRNPLTLLLFPYRAAQNR